MENKTIAINENRGGKLPPIAIDLEEAVLGCILIEQKAIYEVIEFLKPEMFYKDAHKYLFYAILELFNENASIDILTVSMLLKKQKKLELVGGDFYLIQLTQKISSSAHIEIHARIIHQQYIKRELINVGMNLASKSYEEDTDSLTLLNDVYDTLTQVQESTIVGKVKDFKVSVSGFYDNLRNIKPLRTFLGALNKILFGWVATDLIILAARPGMGKTAIILNDILFQAKNGNCVVFFSLEMSEHQIIGRFLSILSGVSSQKIMNPSWQSSDDKEKIKKAQDELSLLPIVIDDKPSITPMYLKLQLSKYKREKSAKICYVDYLQLMSYPNSSTREQEISKISGALKGIAKVLDIPVIALSQLARAVESRGSSKRPLLSDLRDSGSIEQDADIVLFLYRPEYYKIEYWDDAEKTSTKNTSEIDVAKFRNGETKYCRIGNDLSKMRFHDIEEAVLVSNKIDFEDDDMPF